MVSMEQFPAWKKLTMISWQKERNFLKNCRNGEIGQTVILFVLHLRPTSSVRRFPSSGRCPSYRNISSIFGRNNGISIDKQMVRYYGHHFCKMFIREKPIRICFKTWVLATGSGYTIRIEKYIGPRTGLGPNVVIKLLESVRNPEDHIVFFDTSYDLISYLFNKLFRATGEITGLLKCLFPYDKTIDGADRCLYLTRSNGDVLAVKWRTTNHSLSLLQVLKLLRQYSSVQSGLKTKETSGYSTTTTNKR